MLNRNPSDNHRAALEQAQDDRGRRLLQEARGLRGLTPDQVRRIASRLEAAVAPVRRRRLVPVAATLVVLLSAGTALAWATGTLQRLPAVRALFSLHSPASPAPRRSAGARPALRSIDVAAPSEQPTGASPDDLEATAPSGWANRPRPRPAGAGFSPTPPPGPVSGAIRLPLFRRRSRRPRPRPARRRRRTAPSCERENPLPLSFGAGAEITMAKPRWPLSISTIAAFPAARWRSSHDCCAWRFSCPSIATTTRSPFSMAYRSAKGSLPRGRELLTVRGELRIKAGRCDDGRADLAAVLGGSDILAERARNALTHCP